MQNQQLRSGRLLLSLWQRKGFFHGSCSHPRAVTPFLASAMFLPLKSSQVVFRTCTTPTQTGWCCVHAIVGKIFYNGWWHDTKFHDCCSDVLLFTYAMQDDSKSKVIHLSSSKYISLIFKAFHPSVFAKTFTCIMPVSLSLHSLYTSPLPPVCNIFLKVLSSRCSQGIFSYNSILSI